MRLSIWFTCCSCCALYWAWSISVAFGYAARTRSRAGRAAAVVTPGASLTYTLVSSACGKLPSAAASGST